MAAQQDKLPLGSFVQVASLKCKPMGPLAIAESLNCSRQVVCIMNLQDCIN